VQKRRGKKVQKSEGKKVEPALVTPERNGGGTCNHKPATKVFALVATYRRLPELRRLLDSLKAQTRRVDRLVLVDNAADGEVEEWAASEAFPIQYIPSPANLGCGDGLRQGEEWIAGQPAEQCTHIWVLDDDAVPPPETLERLLEAMGETGAALSVPLLSDTEGKLWGFPEPVDKRQRTRIRGITDPVDCEKDFGRGPHSCCWATGTCQLFDRSILESSGWHRPDFWLLGEDLEVSMRMARAEGACFITDVVVPHLPPGEGGGAHSPWARAKFLSLLQNLTYIAFWRNHGFHMIRYLPGNYRRYLRDYGLGLPVWVEVASVFLAGAVLGQPFGRGVGRRLRRRFGVG
jgi:GT2 family glycosyltransferase